MASPFWNYAFIFLLYCSGGERRHNVGVTGSILLKLHGLEDNMHHADFDSVEGEIDHEKQLKAEHKRQSTTGTCTCTCETKPANNSSIINNNNNSSSSSSSSSGTDSDGSSTEPRKHPEAAASLRTDMTANRPHVNHNSNPNPPSNAYLESSASNQIIDSDDDVQSLGLQGDWGHESRFLWKRLPDRMCYRESCMSDKDCCLWYNICDRSAKVCVDCWYGSPCTSERDCCIKYPYCEREWKTDETEYGPSTYVVGGQCVDQG